MFGFRFTLLLFDVFPRPCGNGRLIIDKCSWIGCYRSVYCTVLQLCDGVQYVMGASNKGYFLDAYDYFNPYALRASVGYRMWIGRYWKKI